MIIIISPWKNQWFILVLALTLSHGYNIDLPSYLRYHQATNSMFGFSIALHKGRSDYFSSQSNLIVGAPKFDTSRYQPGVIEAGGVFRCSMNDDDCKLVAFDSKGNNKNTQGETIDRKSHQWLGATVVTGRDNDLVVACAPRYVFHTMTPSRALRYDPVGTCFASHNFEQFHEISPCRTNNWGYHRQGSCQAGFSAAINSNGSRLFIGAPGSWYWQGETYSIPPDASFPYKPPFYQPFGTGGQASSQDVTKPENQIFSTPESTSAYDDSYLGYSMITGDFNADRTDDVAIGMPRGANLVGKIVVNRWNMQTILNITGRQIGEYFGYSLATSDVDGDGLDDIIVGAPMYTEPGNVEGKYDVGRIFILLQGSPLADERFKREHIREGFHTKGRFGLALTTLGDVNGDGYGDFAVGAPYDGPEGRGVVYIYHGSANGPLAKPSQIIKAEDLVEGAPYPRTFGFSLSGGVDMDGNTYPDLAVGAYASDQVFIFKSRPVAAVNAETTFANPSKLISLDDRKCQLQRDHKWVPCMMLTTCWSYTGRHLPNQLIFDVSWLLDAKKTRNPRMFFLRDEGKNIRNQTISLNYGQKYCLNETAYLVDNIQDKLTPLEVEARYNLRSNWPANAPLVRRKRETLEPVIDQNREIILRDAINIQKNCGPDNICEPDLKLEIKTVDKYLFGSPEPLTIEVMITNNNEDAFEAAFYMITPRNLEFRKLEQIDEKSDTPITCSAPTIANNYTIKCDIGNPLEADKLAHFKISLVPAEKFGSSSSYDFYFEANSTNLEKNGSHYDNIYRKSVGIWVDTDLSIKGTSLPDYQLYKADDYKSVENATAEEDLGPQVVHIYEIRNNRPSIIEEAIVYIHYPYETIAGDPLMYLLNQPETGGRIHCDLISEVNERQLKLDTKLQRKSYLHAQGAISNSLGQISGLSGTSSGIDITGGGGGGGHVSNVVTAGGESGGHVEVSQGSNTANGVTVSKETRYHFTPKEKDMLEREDAQDVTGDASYVHQDRANQAVQQEPTQFNRNITSSSSSYTSTNGQLPNGQLRGHSTYGYIQMADDRDEPVVSSRSNQQYRTQQIRLPNDGNSIHYASTTDGIGGGSGGSGNSGHFRTSTIDLPPIRRVNVDNELHRSYGPVSYQQPQHHVVYNKPFYGRENEDYYDEDNQQQGGQQGHSQQWSSSSSSSSSPHRIRRHDDGQTGPKQIDLNSPCQAAKCRTIRCEVTNLGSEDIDAAFVAIRARMVAKTMEKLASNVPLNVSTLAVANVTRLPFIGQPKDQIVKSHEIFYKAEPEPIPVPDVVPLWLFVLAACAGALILMLVILLLYKCGFFNRNRPTDHSQERQPLRNGYHGDEHL